MKKEGRKEEASKAIQTTKQRNTAHPRQSLFRMKNELPCVHACVAWPCCLYGLTCFFPHLSLKQVFYFCELFYVFSIHVHRLTYTHTNILTYTHTHTHTHTPTHTLTHTHTLTCTHTHTLTHTHAHMQRTRTQTS